MCLSETALLLVIPDRLNSDNNFKLNSICVPMPERRRQISELKEISISEFFEKNRHILGFDSLQKALYMIVKEAIDNSLDACEEYRILPEIRVSVKKAEDDEFLITVEDNGPGIERKEVPRVFGQLLYGSRFHSFKQSRGQQGMGITAAVLYGQITTGKHINIRTKKIGEETGWEFQLGINIKENRANVSDEKPVIWDREHGTIITIPAKGKYQVGRQSIFEYLKETATVNPNMDLRFDDPDGKSFHFKRVLDELSRPANPILPYPLGLEAGEILALATESESPSVKTFLSREFSRISKNTADEICTRAELDGDKAPAQLSIQEIKKIQAVLKTVKIFPPPADCLSPLGEEFIRKGLRNIYDDLHPSFYSKPISRSVSTYNGNPFSVEVGLVFGGDLPHDESIRIVRYSNKVPLLYQPGACATSKAVSDLDWRSYGLDQRNGTGIPFGPMILFIHVLGIRIPYTSESKEAVAPVEEIVNEIKAALKSAGRTVRSFLNKRERRKKISEKFRLVSTILPEISDKCASIAGEEPVRIEPVLSKVANVIFVTEEIEAGDGETVVHAIVHNFTSQPRSLQIVADPPIGDITVENATFKIEDLAPGEKYVFTFHLNVEKGRYPGTEYYFTGIDPVWMNGAEPLPADWGVSKTEYEEADDDAEQQD